MAKVHWEYTYDADGMRTGRTDGYNSYRYVYNGGSLSYMELRGSIKFYFSYDASGTPVSVKFGTGTYYYVTNLQGDVTAILNGSGEAVVEYIYDAWGNLRDTTGSMAGTLGYYNPLRYRGYVYDPETELYYLQSRYYDPELGRFLNADAFTSTGQGFLGNNMLAYCLNNPVNYEDYAGTCSYNKVTGKNMIVAGRIALIVRVTFLLLHRWAAQSVLESGL